MYKLLIVDDEPLIVDNLYVLFRDETELELSVYSAYSPIDALEIIRDTKIDILLTDIVMPEMDGLRLQAEAMKFWPDMKVIFLTGLSEIAYVQAGQRMGGVDYVTKNEDDSVVVSAVQVAMAMLDAEIEKRHQLIFSRLNTRAIEPLRRSYFLDRLVSGEERIDADCAKTFREMHIPLSCEQPIMIMVMQLFVPTAGYDALYSVGELTENVIARDASVAWFLYGYRTPVFLIQPRRGFDAACWRALTQSIEDMLASLQKTIYTSMEAHAGAYLVGEAVSWAELPDQFAQSHRELARAASVDHDVLIVGPKLPPGMDRADARPDAYLLIRALERNDRDGFFAALDAETAVKPEGEAAQMEVCLRICTALLTYVNQSHPQKERREQLAELLFHILRERLSWARAIYEYRNFAAHLFEEYELQIGENMSKVAAFVEEYANSHLDEDLSLNRMASVLHFHPVYFSRIFKNAAGLPYSAFIGGLRLKRAKKLLEDKAVKVADISHMLGFENPSYFSRFFKRHTGVTPQNYRSVLDGHWNE